MPNNKHRNNNNDALGVSCIIDNSRELIVATYFKVESQIWSYLFEFPCFYLRSMDA